VEYLHFKLYVGFLNALSCTTVYLNSVNNEN
jgi:hypothetical protein